MSDSGAISWFGSAALVIFMVVFVSIVLWALFQPRETVRRASSLPLDDERCREGES